MCVAAGTAASTGQLRRRLRTVALPRTLRRQRFEDREKVFVAHSCLFRCGELLDNHFQEWELIRCSGLSKAHIFVEVFDGELRAVVGVSELRFLQRRDSRPGDVFKTLESV